MKSRYSSLVDKSIECMVSAIEIYNKPDFKYREDAFCILAVNAWELLLKAKILRDSNNKLSSIYVKTYKKNKSGDTSKRLVYKLSRSKNNLTIDIINAARRLKSKSLIDDETMENIEAVVELRDNSIHFLNSSPLLSVKISELGMACVSNWSAYLFDWFAASLGKYNMYLMPMSFIDGDELSASYLGNRERAVDNILKYINSKEKLYPSDTAKKHNLSIAIEVKVVKASKIDESRRFGISANGDGPLVNVSTEELSKIYPIEYKVLVAKLKERYTDFVANSVFHELKRNLENRNDLCYRYPLNPKNPDGPTKKIYSPAMIKAFDQYYTLKSNTNQK